MRVYDGEIERRLDNWGRANQVCHAGARYCATWARMGDALEGRLASSTKSYDEADAERVTVAWRQLDPESRDILKRFYICNEPPWIIMRRAGVRARHFGRLLADITDELADILQADEKNLAVLKTVAYTPKNLIPALLAETVAQQGGGRLGEREPAAL